MADEQVKLKASRMARNHATNQFRKSALSVGRPSRLVFKHTCPVVEAMCLDSHIGLGVYHCILYGDGSTPVDVD